ncbi:MAG TPA: hypothetical protein PLV42_06820 [bacterium]|nr:hypothetical protein [bacterium]
MFNDAHGLDFDVFGEITKGPLVVNRFEDLTKPEHCGRLIIQDRDRPEHDVIELPFRSFSKHLIGALWNEKIAPESLGAYCKRVSGATHSSGGPASGQYDNYYASKNYGGLQLGSDDTAFSLSQYGLQALILQGTGAGQLQKAEMSVQSLVTSGPDCYFDLQRLFTNASGGDVTFKEAGVFLLDGADAAAASFMIARDLTGTITIANGQAKRVTYRIGISATDDKSFNRNIVMWMRHNFGKTTHTWYQTSGVLYTCANWWESLLCSTNGVQDCKAGEGISSYGLRVGTGNNVCTVSDNQVQTLINHGNGAGQLYYRPSTQVNGAYTPPTISGNDVYCVINRKFDNNSGSDITVKEYDLVTTLVGNPGTKYACLLRGRVNGGTGVVVPAGGSLKLNVKLKTSV